MDRNQLEKLSLSVPCPTCGAAPGQKCELNSGQPRTAPHRDRRLEAADSEKAMDEQTTCFGQTPDLVDGIFF
jgi:hypothetical protein